MSLQPVIFHIPHASTVIPPDAGIIARPDDVREEIRILTDHFTDDIYGSLAEAEDVVVIAPVSRLVVDVERFPNDADEPMSARGMGAVYLKRHNGEPLRASLDQREELMERYYRPHHRSLDDAVKHHLNRFHRAIILDCHSFMKDVRPYERDKTGPRPEICIGTDDFHTAPGMADVLESTYAAHGFSVARNTPFSGAIVPLSVYGKDRRVSSVMIELRRDIYMDENTSTLHSDTSRVRAATGDAVRALSHVSSLRE
jgi:N-formylglutamate deformylase